MFFDDFFVVGCDVGTVVVIVAVVINGIVSVFDFKVVFAVSLAVDFEVAVVAVGGGSCGYKNDVTFVVVVINVFLFLVVLLLVVVVITVAVVMSSNNYNYF